MTPENDQTDHPPGHDTVAAPRPRTERSAPGSAAGSARASAQRPPSADPSPPESAGRPVDPSTGQSSGPSGPAPGRPDTGWPFHAITHTASRYMQALEFRLKQSGMDPAAWRILMALDDERNLSVTEISRLCVIKPNTVTKVIQRMTAQGLVTTHSCRRDARRTQVHLTRQGRARRRDTRAIADELADQAFAGLSPEDRAALDRLLDRVNDRLD